MDEKEEIFGSFDCDYDETRKTLTVNGAPFCELLPVRELLLEFYAKLHAKDYNWHSTKDSGGDPVKKLLARINGVRTLIEHVMKNEPVGENADKLIAEVNKRMSIRQDTTGIAS